MATVPGSAGLPLIGDSSYEFYKDAVKHYEKRMEQTKSRVFLARFLNKPTIFVGSNSILHDLFTVHHDKMELGYKQFMGEIYGDNIIFSDGDCAMSLRESLKHLFTQDAITTYQEKISRIVKIYVDTLNVGQSICIYDHFKKLSIEICLSLFLGLDFSQADAGLVTELTTTHWHGIISVPVAIKIPKMSASTYSKALEAKKQLLEIIKSRREEKKHEFPKKVENLENFDEIMINNHLLLFTSALVPKGLSSILTSFALEICKSDRVGLQPMMLEDEDLLDCYILEVLRSHPPFLGGRRVITQDMTVGGLKMPAGHAVLYHTYAAHRDPAVFENPDEFKPGRWLSQNKDDKDKLFCFGAGPRQCLGQKLIWAIIKTVIKEMLKRFELMLEPNQDLTYKILPVSRPKDNVMVHLNARSGSPET